MRLLGCMFWVIAVVETKDGTVSVASAFAGYQEGRTNNLLLLRLFIAALFLLYICFGSQVFGYYLITQILSSMPLNRNPITWVILGKNSF